MRLLLLISFLTVLPALVFGTEKAPPSCDSQALQGDWIVVGIEGGGYKATPQELRGMQWSIRGDTITGTDPDGSSGKMRYKIDPTVSPKRFDITSLQGKLAGQTDPGIYELNGRRLRICYRNPDNQTGDCPKSFADAAPVGSGYGIIVLEKKSD